MCTLEKRRLLASCGVHLVPNISTLAFHTAAKYRPLRYIRIAHLFPGELLLHA